MGQYVEPSHPTTTAARLLPPVVLTVLFAIAAGVTWRSWPDVLVDFGHEVYLPWQLASGKVLYRDLAHLYGPLSQYLNAGLFAVFGASLTTLFTANLVLLAAALAGAYAGLAAVFRPLAALTSLAVVVLVFAFSQYLMVGNYTLVSPYSHEATHGLYLTEVLLFLLWRSRQRGGAWLVLAGLTLGLVWLTRVELAVAATGASLVALALDQRTVGARGTVGRIAVLIAAALVPTALAIALFCLAMPLGDAVAGVLGPCFVLAHGVVANNPFFVAGMGLNDPVGNLGRMAQAAGLVVAVIAAVAWSTRRIAGAPVRAVRLLGYVALVVAPLLATQASVYAVGQPLLLLVGLTFGLAAWSRSRAPSDDPDRPALDLLIVLAVFSLGLLGKMLLANKVFHYGFFLALPATITTIIALVWLVPERLLGADRGGRHFRGVAAATLLIGSAAIFWTMSGLASVKTEPVGQGADAFYAFPAASDPRTAAVQQAAAWVEANTPASATVAVLPHGLMINWLTRRPSSLRYTTLMMTELLAFGEDAVLADLVAHPPDFLALVPTNGQEFGVGEFGQDPAYGARLVAWALAHYAPAAVLGSPALRLTIYRRSAR